MNKKYNRAVNGPGWIEVIFGAVLSAIIGVILGAVLLIAKPVVVAKEMPKAADIDPKATYYLEGSRESGRAREAMAKRRAFGEGQSVSLIEDELNALAAPATGATPPKPKPADKNAPAESEPTFVSGAPNFRVRDGALQFAVPVTINALGDSRKIIVQTRGGFVKKGDVFVFEPDTFHIGSCPVQRLPFVVDYVRKQFVSSQQIPDDLKAAWLKLASVSIEGNMLKLTMP